MNRKPSPLEERIRGYINQASLYIVGVTGVLLVLAAWIGVAWNLVAPVFGLRYMDFGEALGFALFLALAVVLVLGLKENNPVNRGK
jgi:hypothetical protein